MSSFCFADGEAVAVALGDGLADALGEALPEGFVVGCAVEGAGSFGELDGDAEGCTLAVADALGVAVAVCSRCGEADYVGRLLLVASGVASASSSVTPEVMRTSSLVIVV